MTTDYDRLVAKVDALCATIEARCVDALACRGGCAGCCQVELTVARVEALAVVQALESLPPVSRAGIAARAAEPPGGTPRCVMLDEHDLCAIHPARPLVCRTQGLPLLYPSGLVPAEAVKLRTNRGEVTVCPLNFRERDPEAPELVDAERIDTLLALVDRLAAERDGTMVGKRFSLRALAAGERPEEPR